MQNKTQIKNLLNDIYNLAKNEKDLVNKLKMYQFCTTLYWHNYSGTFVNKQIEKDLVEISEKIISEDLEENFDEKHILHIMTEAYETGGHTRVVKHWIEATNFKHTVLINKSNSGIPNFLREIVELKNGKIIINSENTLIDKAKFLVKEATKYKFIVLHHHPDDILPLIAFGSKKFKRPIFMYNHADHVWGCGYSVCNKIIELCKQGVIHSNKYRAIPENKIIFAGIPLYFDNYRTNIKNKYEKSIVTMASSYKFQPVQNINYQDFVDKLLTKDNELNFYVIGVEKDDKLWQKLLNKFPQRLHLLGILAKEEAHKLIINCKLFLDSFPLGSSTSVIEAVNLGVPILSYSSPIQHMDSYKMYSYNNLEELLNECNKVLNFSIEEVISFSEKQRESFIQWHSLDFFKKNIELLNEDNERDLIELKSDLIEDEYIKTYTDFLYELNRQKYFIFEENNYLENYQLKQITIALSKFYLLENTISLNKTIDWLGFIMKNKSYFIQIFINDDNCKNFLEKNSIKFPVSINTKMEKFEFDFKDFTNIKNLRFDPLNDCCVINISKIGLILNDDSYIDLKENIQSNTCSHHGDNFFFESLDPQVYFENVHFESLSIKKFIIELQYCHVGKDALQTCIYQIIDDKNFSIKNLERERNKIYSSFIWKLLNFFKLNKS